MLTMDDDGEQGLKMHVRAEPLGMFFILLANKYYLTIQFTVTSMGQEGGVWGGEERNDNGAAFFGLNGLWFNYCGLLLYYAVCGSIPECAYLF